MQLAFATNADAGTLSDSLTDGVIPPTFQINDISIVYKEKRLK